MPPPTTTSSLREEPAADESRTPRAGRWVPDDRRRCHRARRDDRGRGVARPVLRSGVARRADPGVRTAAGWRGRGDRADGRRARPPSTGAARGAGRRRPGGRRRGPPGDLPQPAREPGHHRRLVGCLARRGHRPAAGSRHRFPGRRRLRVRPGRPRVPLRPDAGTRLLDAHGRARRRRARLVLLCPRRARPVLRRPVLVAAGDRVLVAGQPRHRHLGEGGRGRRADPRRRAGGAAAEVAPQRALPR